ncbi:MAG: hypothetical protein JNL08_05185 [Planctomycetes bacterium]|nr:hypothetical protein [Planctomycetota bacterium]
MHAAAAWCVCGLGCSLAQAQVAPPGFGVRGVCAETAQVPWVRAIVPWHDGEHLIAIRHELLHARGERSLRHKPVFAWPPTDDIAFVLPLGGNQFAVGALVAGDVACIDLGGGPTVLLAGVANAFDAVARGADLLVTANPTWPAAGAHAGVWLLGPGRVPREILPLVGPSGPLVWLGNGDLVVGELGPIVPPPPGAARLLRIPAARIAAAVAGATLSLADVAAIGAGFDGLYDLAVDTQGRVHASDPARSIVVHTAPGGLTPAGTTLDVGTGRYALALHFAAHGAAPLRGYQPPAAAPHLCVVHSDFATRVELLHLAPARPSAQLPGGPSLAVGTHALQLSGAPPNGLAVALAGPGTGTEVPFAWGDVPVWFGLAPVLVAATAAVDATGSATLALHNPGSVPGPFTVQVLALDASGSGDVGTTSPLAIEFEP